MKKPIRTESLAMAFALGMTSYGTLWATVPPMSDEELAMSATLIVGGHVTSVAERDETSHPNWRPWQKLVTAHYTVTMDAEKIEKGSLPPGDKSLQFTGYSNIRTPPHWVGGTNTLRLDLKVGDEIKVYLRREGDHWFVFHHMGLWQRR